MRLRNKDISRRFGLAFDLLYSWNHTDNLRIALANIWCGLEALFGRQDDKPVTKKLVERICCWNPELNISNVRALYNKRCDVVHGRWINDNEIIGAVNDSQRILRLSLIKAIETNKTTLPDW